MLCGEKQDSRTGSCQASTGFRLFSVAISQVVGNNPARCSKADRCSQLDNSLLLSSDTGTSIRWEEAYTGRLKQCQDETKGFANYCLTRLDWRMQRHLFFVPFCNTVDSFCGRAASDSALSLYLDQEKQKDSPERGS